MCVLYHRLLNLVSYDFKDMREKRPEKGSLPRIAVCESLIPHVESSFFGFTDVGVQQQPQVLQGEARPMRSDEAKSLTKPPQGQVRFEMDIPNDKERATWMNGHNVITALAGDHMCNSCAVGQETLMKK